MKKDYKNLLIGLLGGVTGGMISNISDGRISLIWMLVIAGTIGYVIGYILHKLIPEKD